MATALNFATATNYGILCILRRGSNLISIESLNDPLSQKILGLLQAKANSEEILIDDPENIDQALKANLVLTYLIFTPEYEEEPLVKTHTDPQTIKCLLSRRTGKKIFGSERMSRIFAIAKRPKPYVWGDLVSRKGDILVLEDLSIAGNVGAIVRSARAFGASGLIYLKNSTVELDAPNPSFDLFDRRIIRSSRGHVFHLPSLLCSVEELSGFCSQSNLPLVVMSVSASKTLKDISQSESRIAFLFGSEKEGHSQLAEKVATQAIKIPMNQDVESLNVSVAASIVLYERFFYTH